MTKLANAGKITFVESTGAFSGAGFENDPNNRIDWVNSSVLTWIGTVNDDWYNLSNWSASYGIQRVPLVTDNVVIAVAVNKPIIKVDGAVCKDLTVNNGAFLTMSTPAGSPVDFDVKGSVFLNGYFEMQNSTDTVVVARDWARATSGTFKPGNGTVIFDGSGGLNNINNATSSFNNLVVQGTGVSYELNANTSVLNNLTVYSTLDANGYNMTVGGDWNTSTGLFTPRTGTVTMNGVSGTRTINTASAFNNLTLSGASNTFQLLSNTSTNGNLNINNATLLLNTHALSMGDGVGADALNISTNGRLDIRANESLQLGTNASVNVSSGGVIKIVGTDATNLATVTHQSSGNYSFVVNNGGTIHAKYYLIDYVNASGISLLAGALLDPVNNFSEGTFSHGLSGGRYLSLQNEITTALGFTGDSTVVTNVIFNSGSSYNVRRLSGTGYLRFRDADGVRGGFIYEEDDNTPSFGRVRWSYTSPTLFWTGNVSTDWNDPLNWDTGNGTHGVPALVTNVFIQDVTATTNRFPVLNSIASGTAKKVSIYEYASITLANNYNLVCTGSMDIQGKLMVATNSTSNITVGGSWTVDATTGGQFIHGGASTVTLNSSATAVKTITPGNSPFNHLLVNASGVYQTQGSLDADGNLTIASGTLQVMSPSHQINVGGNWSNSGTFIPNSGAATVVFDGPANQTISKASGETFNNVTFAGTGNKVLGSNLTVTGNLNISLGAGLDGNTRTITLTGNWVNKGNPYIPGTSTVNMIGSSVQQIGRSSLVGENFYNLVINNTSPVAPQIDVTSDINILANGTMTFTRGIFESTSADILTFNNNTTVNGSSALSYVSGPVIKIGNSDFVYPIGKGGRWARIAISNLTVSSTFRAEYFPAMYPNGNVAAGSMNRISGKEHWTLDRTAGTGSAYVRLYWEDAGYSQISTLTDLIVAHFGGANWDNQGQGNTTGGTGSGVAGSIRSLGLVSSFSPFTFGSLTPNNPLPISLLAFNATYLNKTVDLTWTTLREINNRSFTVERSKNGKDFSGIVTVDGAGNSTTKIEYHAIDGQPWSGVSYYRLKQTDGDGSSTFSKIVSVNADKPLNLSAYPNPSNGRNITLQVDGVETPKPVNVQVTNMDGHEHVNEEVQLEGNEIHLNPLQLPSGLYLIKVKVDGKNMVKKIVVNKE